MALRYDIREDREGWTVFDIFTGMAVVVELDPQTGLDEQAARELKLLLNGKSLAGDRDLRQ